MSYYNLATNQVLLRSYEELALLHKRKNAPTESREELAKTFGMSGDLFFRDSKRIDNYVYNFPLLSLNAAIIEGILRYILSQNLRSEINKHVEENSRKGQTSKSPYENILDNFLIRVENDGGIENVFKYYFSYLKFHFDSEIDKEVFKQIKILFRLRNILAHGTTLVETAPDLIDANNLAFFKQQEMLKDAKKLLDELYGENDLLKNISHYEVPEYFMNITKQFLSEFKNKFSANYSLSPEDILSLDKIINYSWGYRLV
ncbi:hypothetical protein RJ729_13960 [Acinetobacter pittii]|jgi:hypothetical protein|uniref:hypothetical protein n=1 Tax=Acinetobacter pittii TaxID=48296 RepID=UPI0038920B9F